MGVGSGLYMYDAEILEILWCDVVVKRSRSLSDLLMSSCATVGISQNIYQLRDPWMYFLHIVKISRNYSAVNY